MCLGVAVSVLSVGVCKQSPGFLGPLRSCDRDTNSEAENLALFKFYCTPYCLGVALVGCSTLLLPTPSSV